MQILLFKNLISACYINGLGGGGLLGKFTTSWIFILFFAIKHVMITQEIINSNSWKNLAKSIEVVNRLLDKNSSLTDEYKARSDKEELLKEIESDSKKIKVQLSNLRILED